MKRASAILFLAASLAAGAVRADDRSVVVETDRLLSWRADDGSFLWLGAWVLTDFQAFPRTETGYGASWDADFMLRAAHGTVRFRWGEWMCGRLDGEFSDASAEVQDAWLEYCGLAPFFQVRAGRFRVPFGLVQQFSTPELKLQDAAMVAGNPKDYRDLGLELHGAFWLDRVRWAVAAVTGSRDIAVDVNERPDVVGRLTFHPLMGFGAWFERLSFGGSGGWGEGPTRHGFRGRNSADYTFLAPATVRGARWRAGAELEWVTPGFRLAAEYQHGAYDRDGVTDSQRIGGSMVTVEDLDSQEVWGWYVELSGHPYGGVDAQGDPRDGLELAARFEHLEFGDGDRPLHTDAGTEQHAPLIDSWVQAVTAGASWYFGFGLRLSAWYQAMRYGRAALASDHEDGDPEEGEAWVHHVFARAQFVY
ncbi:MAG: hypothetical protein JXB32_13680 [Deltaproteobacteria bacterium]|nr:hypothetical protein [Deltaproteobacteria bacterium]